MGLHRLSQFFACGSALSVVGVSSAAIAQVNTPPSSTPTKNQSVAGKKAVEPGIGDIVVTANRVATSAQDTPIALNAYSGSALRDQGIATVRDLSLIDPSVNVSNTGGAAYVAVRGIASTDFTEIGDPSVPVARDGFFTNRSYSINSSMYDLARIEVLKGPQGTLNGRNSTGGLISIITNQPEMRDGGYGSVDVGNYGAFSGELGANLMLADGFAVRASGLFSRHNGYRKLDGPGRSGDDEDFASGRVQAKYRAGGLSLWASYQHDSRDVNGDAALKAPLGGPQPNFDGDVDNFPSNVPIYTHLEGDRYRWEAAYAGLGSLNLVYSGGFDEQHWTNGIDLTGPTYPADRRFEQAEQPKTWNHEVRLSNRKGSRLFFQIGYFRFLENNAVASRLDNLDYTGAFGPSGPLSALTPTNPVGIQFSYGVRTLSQAGFGQVEYDLTNKLQLSVGARYTWDEKLRSGQAVLFLPALVSPFAPPLTLITPGDGNLNAGKPTWHAGLNYRPSHGILIYGKYDRGYKSGGFNSNGSSESLPYGPETLDSFELGAKNTFLDGNLRVNLAGFYFNYRGYQATQVSAILGGGSGIFNVGSARIIGAEAEIVARLASATRLNMNASVLNTKFGNNITAVDGSGAPFDISGNRLPNAPSFTASVGVEQRFELPSGSVTAHADGRYSSNFYYSVFNQPDTQSKSYFFSNAFLKYTPVSGVWDIQIYARNIFNKNVLAYASENFVSNTNIYQFQAPRTFGARLGFRF